jgi:hypothetical protein
MDSAAVTSLRHVCVDALAMLHADDQYWSSDHALARILVARKGDLLAAQAQLRQIVTFRNERQAWRYLDPSFYQQPEVFRRYAAWGMIGSDREGYPIIVERIGQQDSLGLVEVPFAQANYALKHMCHQP